MNGFEFEDEFKSICEKMGYQVVRMPMHHVFDFVVNGHRVQCKKTDFVDVDRGRTVGRIRVSRGSSCKTTENYRIDDFDFFAIRFQGNVFIVPTASIGFLNGFLKRKFPVRRLKRFMGRFDLLESRGNYFAQQQLEFNFQSTEIAK